MIKEYRCSHCKHLMFKSRLKLFLTKQHDADKGYIEPTFPKCGLINQCCKDQEQTVTKKQEPALGSRWLFTKSLSDVHLRLQ